MADTATTTPASHDDVRWLDADELLMWRSFIDAASTVLGSVEADMKRDTDGLTFDDYEVLVHLSESPEHRLRMAELSERLLHSRSRLTQRVDRMVDRGLLAREKCPDDKRGTFAVLDHLAYVDQEAGLSVGVKSIRDDDWWAPDHVPGRPMFPGALMIETAAQIASHDYSRYRLEGTSDRFVGFVMEAVESFDEAHLIRQRAQFEAELQKNC